LVVTILQGQIWWLEQPNQKRRPAMVLTRNEALPVLIDVMVAPLTTRVRALPTEVALDAADGVPRPSVANVQHVLCVPKSMLTRRIGMLAPGRWHEVCTAMQAAIDC
jgi:mRNA interferase MazF